MSRKIFKKLYITGRLLNRIITFVIVVICSIFIYAVVNYIKYRKFEIKIQYVYYYDSEGEKCFLCDSNYDLMIEEKQKFGLKPYSILHAIYSI